MERLQKNNATEIYALFLKKLSKIEAIFLLGLYYSDTFYFSESDFVDDIIIGQQLLTYLKRNPFPVLVDNDTIKKLFLDEDDDLDLNCHPSFLLDGADEIDINKILDIIPELNNRLIQHINVKFIDIQNDLDTAETSKVASVEEIIDASPEDKIFRESDNAKEVIDKFLSYYPQLKKNKYHRSILMLGISTGRFIFKFLNEKFHVFFIEKDEVKVKKIKKAPHLLRCKNEYFDNIECCTFNAIWSYAEIGRMKKDEIIQALRNIEMGLVEKGYACISFMYGTGHKTINNHYYTLMDEYSFKTIAAKTRKLEIKDIWTREYTRSDGTTAKRLNVILRKTEEERILKICCDESQETKFPKSIDVQKFQLSSRIANMEIPESGVEIEQKITISKDGRIWITRYRLIENEKEMVCKPVERKIISIDKNVVERIFFMTYRSIFLNEREKIFDAGEWKLTLTATNEDVFTASGSFGVPVLFNNKIDVCKIIRESIPLDGLWIFDDLVE